MDQYTLYIAFAPLAAVSSVAVAIYAWMRRDARGAWTLALQMIAIAGWLSTNIAQLWANEYTQTLFWLKASYLFVCTAPVLWLTFALEYTGHQRWAHLPRSLILWVIPATTLMMVITNGWHHLYWTSNNLLSVNPNFSIMQSTYGPWFWVNTIYIYLLILLASALIAIEYFKSFRLYRSQSLWLIGGSLVPVVFHVTYLLKLFPHLHQDYSALAFAVGGITIAISIFRHRLFEIMPVARATLVDNLQDGMIVLDINNRIVDINPVAKTIFGLTSQEAIGTLVYDILPPNIHISLNPREQRYEITLKQGEHTKYYELSIAQVQDKMKKHLGYLITLHDITERVELLKHVQELATLDPLTNLFNRRYFTELANKEIERARRYRAPLSLIIVDIDFFKPVNDQHGHAVGDQVLLEFSDLVRSSLRSTDIVARYGGEEFLFLLPETKPEEASRIANRLCKQLAETPLETGAGPISITMSAGVAGNQGGLSLEEMLDRADKALYVAKETGRNRAVVWKQNE
jgi:diguanylate cyclase (GGDEF)-like protein/PAS domain S-box-containing protein